jgi:hypothetical protein
MKKISILLLFVFFLLQGCRKDNITLFSAFLKNTTAHSIKILFYKNGFVSSSDTIKLLTNQEIRIAYGVHRGLLKNPGFYSEYFGSGNDSIVVIFDNLYKVSHYGVLPANLSNRYYEFVSLRHLGNPKSYQFNSTQTAKNKLENVHRYEFVEADYNYAR